MPHQRLVAAKLTAQPPPARNEGGGGGCALKRRAHRAGVGGAGAPLPGNDQATVSAACGGAAR
jgi:hypothetical protein